MCIGFQTLGSGVLGYVQVPRAVRLQDQGFLGVKLHQIIRMLGFTSAIYKVLWAFAYVKLSELGLKIRGFS